MVLRICKSQFIKTLNELGNENEKLIVLHYAMLGEGIDVKSFTGVVFLIIHFHHFTPNPWVAYQEQPGKYGIVTIVQHENNTNEVKNLSETS